jgi:eukaryotic-like serine/threonine-protein kinase
MRRGDENHAVSAREELLTLPQTIDSFTLTQRIGAGAMGEVYLATEALTGRQVAVKVMSAHLIGNRRAETRFRREIAAMGQLRHPGIPAFAGYGELIGGRPYLAMQFVDGRSLDAFVPDNRPLPEDLALWVTLQLADVIGYCNRESGMIHRDLKPSNVMVDMRGMTGLCEQSQLKVIDFGLATYIDFGDFEDFSIGVRDRAAGGTIVGEVVGTPAFMSPEQIRGEDLTFQSDIYAIGAILYNLLTGCMPYTGSSAGVVMAAHLDAPVPDPSRVVPVRPATVAAVQRAMAKTATARFRSYTQFIASLQAARFAAGQATKRISRTYQAAPGSTGWRRPNAPAQPPPPGSSGTTGWRRPQADDPVRKPTQPSPALEPADARPEAKPTWSHPALPPAEQSDEFPATPAVTPPQPTANPPSSTGWRRPVRTPPPTPP